MIEQPMKCQVCGAATVAAWEHTDDNMERWFAGVYQCGSCNPPLVFSASGSIQPGGRRRVRDWKPGCPSHGPRQVIRISHGAPVFRCLHSGCGWEAEVIDGELVRTDQLGRVLAVA